LTDQVLTGIRVLDLSQGMGGGYCTKLLADFGADVLKIEPPKIGDNLRSQAPFKDDSLFSDGAAFLYLNTNKKSITLDIFSDTGKDLFFRLLKDADVVVESFKPGTMEAAGLSFSDLEAVKPGVIMVAISYFGQNGPYAQYHGSELVAFALSGYMYLTGSPDREPLQAGGSQSNYQAGLGGALSVLASLMFREETGEGQYIDISAVDAVKSAFDGGNVFSTYDRSGIVPRRVGTRNIVHAPTMFYPSTLLPCADGHIHVHTAPGDPEALGLLTGIDRLTDPELLATQWGHREEIDELLTEWLKDKDKHETMELAQELRIPWTKVSTIDEVLDDPQLAAREHFREVEHPEAGTMKYPASGLKFSETPWQPGRAPLLGEHNDEVYREKLGLTALELSSLRERGVL
jgi:CoA:oxalate CoA-transferase